MTKSYAYGIHEMPVYYKDFNGENYGACITDGDDLQKVIEKAREYFIEEYAEDRNYGEHKEDVVLVTIDEDGVETAEVMTIDFDVERYVDPIREHGTWNSIGTGCR